MKYQFSRKCTWLCLVLRTFSGKESQIFYPSRNKHGIDLPRGDGFAERTHSRCNYHAQLWDTGHSSRNFLEHGPDNEGHHNNCCRKDD